MADWEPGEKYGFRPGMGIGAGGETGENSLTTLKNGGFVYPHKTYRTSPIARRPGGGVRGKEANIKHLHHIFAIL